MALQKKGAARLTRGLLGLALFSVAAFSGAGGCSNDMDPKQCLEIRSNAFEILNKAQNCNTDADCRQSDWPNCAKPLSNDSADKIKPLKESFAKGKCKEEKVSCADAPEVYCKQGLCVNRFKGTPEGASNTPTDKIIVQ